MTNQELIPPYRRLRLCGPNVVSSSLEKKLRAAAHVAVALIQGPIVLEVEFVHTHKDELLVLEINPRIAGTTKMSALATSTTFLDICLYGHDQSSLTANHCVAELPINSAGANEVLGPNLIATSRLTIVGRDWNEIFLNKSQAQQAGWELDALADDLLVQYITNGHI